MPEVAPFVQAGRELAQLGPLQLAVHAVRGVVAMSGIDPERIGTIAYGAVIPEPGKPNIAREIVFETGLPRSIETQTIPDQRIALAADLREGRLLSAGK